MESISQLQELIQKAAATESNYTSSLLNYMQIQVGRLDIPLQERQEVIRLFSQGINELSNSMCQSGMIIGCVATELGVGEQILNMVMGGELHA